MKDITSGRLLPEVKLVTTSYTHKEAAITGEGHPPRPVDIHRIQEEFGMLSIPHKDSGFFMDEGKPGEDRKKAKPI
jgi:hypothetical protein